MRTVVRVGLTAVAVPALLVGAGAGTASANEFVVNDNGSATMVDASYRHDSGTGYVTAWQQKDGVGYVSFFEQSGGWVKCAGGRTRNEADDVFGYVGTLRYGEGVASVTAGARYATGSAAGTVEAYRDDVDDCAATYATSYVGAVLVSLDLAATGPVHTTRSRDGYHVPSVFNGHYSFSFTGRTAVGTATVDGVSGAAEGLVGKTTWTYHSN